MSWKDNILSFPKSVQRAIHNLEQRLPGSIEDASDDRADGEGMWLYLNPGFICFDMDCRTIHEDTAQRMIDKIDSVFPDPPAEQVNPVEPQKTGSIDWQKDIIGK